MRAWRELYGRLPSCDGLLAASQAAVSTCFALHRIPAAVGITPTSPGWARTTWTTLRLFEDRVAARAKCEQDRLEFLEVSAEQLHELLRTLLSPAGAAVLTGELAQYLVDCTRSGLAPGAERVVGGRGGTQRAVGLRARGDPHAGFALPRAPGPFCPVRSGPSGWRATFPACRLSSLDDGHLTLIEHHLEQVHAWLLERLH